MKNERDVKARVKEILKELGAWWYMPVQGGYGVAGVPDFVGCYRGKFFAIETKFGKYKATPLQEMQMEKIRAADGACNIIYEKNIHTLKGWIECL